MIHRKENLKLSARLLRANMTEAESVLWERIRRKQILGLQAYRQKTIGFYIVDFYIPKAKLVIEVDGFQHIEKSQLENDEVRSDFLESKGLKVLRFRNERVLAETDEVVKTIYSRIVERLNRKV
jgi:very-short-patch-repair endonuclease